ncbi:MAG: hypothetical protein DRJ01_08835 [Bacteroidetes bacterium]|nr:MAG: hypothetical protein DRJ01_08835 [Bacteroidota bacterium]
MYKRKSIPAVENLRAEINREINSEKVNIDRKRYFTKTSKEKLELSKQKLAYRQLRRNKQFFKDVRNKTIKQILKFEAPRWGGLKLELTKI